MRSLVEARAPLFLKEELRGTQRIFQVFSSPDPFSACIPVRIRLERRISASCTVKSLMPNYCRQSKKPLTRLGISKSTRMITANGKPISE